MTWTTSTKNITKPSAETPSTRLPAAEGDRCLANLPAAPPPSTRTRRAVSRTTRWRRTAIPGRCSMPEVDSVDGAAALQLPGGESSSSHGVAEDEEAARRTHAVANPNRPTGNRFNYGTY
uniref:(northern house mosquito) hypothetical protein n=1 Tax=Culex pipiens TaxID=7175 RepID=A0A8D8HH44_CULPI